jgi:hypothetical protein
MTLEPMTIEELVALIRPRQPVKPAHHYGNLANDFFSAGPGSYMVAPHGHQWVGVNADNAVGMLKDETREVWERTLEVGYRPLLEDEVIVEGDQYLSPTVNGPRWYSFRDSVGATTDCLNNGEWFCRTKRPVPDRFLEGEYSWRTMREGK